MDVSVSVSFFQDELASTIEHAVKAAVDTVLCEITKVVGGKFTEFQMEMAGKEKENESLKLRLEISESELKAVRECMNAADADIKQPLRNMNPDCNEHDFQRNENQGLFQDPKEGRAMPKSEAQEGPRIEAVYTLEESFDQEWCASLKQVTELTCVKDEEVPRLECVPIKEEFIEQECVPIAEEVPTENNVCTLEENNKLGSSLCDDCPPECELGYRARSSLQRGRLMPTATMNQTEETYSGDSYWYHEDILNVTVSNSTSVFQSPLSPLVDKAISCITIIILFITMVSLGCTMEISKIKAHILKPKGVAIAVVAQYGIMPLTAFTLAKVFQLGSIESVTVLICGCCPGGNLSNIFALALKGDMNLR
ncbi:UNVERIFIED_CONTAM: hypothetical protein FKN15_074881 [Acipenser sinensis]